MIDLALRSEYSFRNTMGFVDDLVELTPAGSSLGIADDNNTFSHVYLQKAALKAGIKPIFGVRLMVVRRTIEKTRTYGPQYVFLAKNNSGLQEIYKLVKRAYERFYYHAQVTVSDVAALSQDVIVIAHTYQDPVRVDYIGLCTLTPPAMLDVNLPKVFINYNNYTKPEDKKTYELMMGAQGMAQQTYPQHILSEAELLRMWPGCTDAMDNTLRIASQCSASIPSAPMISYPGRMTLRKLCEFGARQKGITLDGKYRDRFERELTMIEDNDFSDYFLIVSDMVRRAKKSMLVGPSRGSSAGSLVCYLADITEVDPIKFDLMFERFVDVNRSDLPDIDIDFPDKKRKKVIAHLSDTYGEDHVSRIANVNRLKPKSAIGRFAQSLGIPKYETEAVKDAIISRSGGDARAAMCIEDTFTGTEPGRHLIKQYPIMSLVSDVEGHASHAGIHAAGILICNNPLWMYGGVNVRDGSIMMDKHGAEGQNLLKIDVLGLRTLSILEEVADQIGMPYRDYYSLPLDDELTFSIFNELRLSGIFQFQGAALQYVTRQMGVESFDDIAAITALARPGPIHSGGTSIFIGRRTGAEPVEYLSDDESVVRATKDTYGVIIYQEQLMQIGREYGELSWEDVSELRKAASKSLGEEYFGKFRDQFVKGAVERGNDADEAQVVWENMVTFGSWGFNKSHAYGYGLISYWTAWAKAHHPVEFAVANMNNTSNPDQGVRILRDMVKNDGIEYVAIDPDLSIGKWSVQDGMMYGGLTDIHGIGVKKAQQIAKARKGQEKWTPSMVSALTEPSTPYTILFPAHHFYGDIYDKPEEFGLKKAPVEIETVNEPGEYLVIARLLDQNLRDLNEYQSVVKRGGKLINDHTLFLNLIVEDDTDSIVCQVGRYDYERIGLSIAEKGVEGKTWYLIKGKVESRFRRIKVDHILDLEEWRKQSEVVA